MSSTEIPLSQGALESMARQAALQEGLDPSIFAALINEESSWNPAAHSAVGASGLTQLMPATAQALGVTNINDPVQNLRGGARYLKQQLDAFAGNYNLALASYNAGPAAVRKYGGVPPYPETQDYVKTIMGNAKSMPQAQGNVSPLPSPTRPGVSQPPAGLPATPQARSPGAEAALRQLPPIDLSGVGDLSSSLLGGFGGGGLGGLSQSAMRLIDQPLADLKPPTPVERQNVQDMQNNFSFKFSVPESAVGHGGVAAVALAKQYLGTPYVWGGESAKGFDCSGLLQYTWAKQGVSIPRTTYDQWQTGQPVAKNGLQPGDAVFFEGSDPKVENGQTLPGHVGMYVGNGNIIQAPHTGATVEITPLSHMPGYMGARRFTGGLKA